MSRENTLRSEAEALLSRAGDNPGAVAAEARALADRAAASEDEHARAIALRAAAVASVGLFDLPEATKASRAARTAAAYAGDQTLRGEVETTYAAVLAWSGHQRQARVAIDRAVTLLDGVPRARALVQRGTLRGRAGDFQDALTDLTAALPVLEKAHDLEWLSRLHNNWGLVLGFRGELRAAESHLTQSLRYDEQLGHAASAAQAMQNIGWIAARAGDIPRALERLDAAEAMFIELGYPEWELWGVRCDALMAAHLVEDAVLLAQTTVDRLAESEHATSHAEALLRLARASQMAGDNQRSLHAARQAVREFEEQGRTAWAVYAEYLAYEAEASLGDLNPRRLARVAQAAGRLSREGFDQASQHAHLLAAILAARAGDLAMSRSQLERASVAKRRGPADLRVQAWLAEAALRHAQGDLRGVDRAARAGLAVVERYQAMLGASDARVAVAAHASGLATMGLRLAVGSGDGRRLFRWMERTRAGSLRFPPVSPPDDTQLVADLTELREIEAKLRDVDRNEAQVTELTAQRVAAQERIRARSLATRGNGDHIPMAPKAENVLGSLRDRTMVEYGRIDGVLHAVVLHRNRVRRHELGDAGQVMTELDGLRMSVRRILTGHASEASLDAARRLIDAGRDRLDEILVRPLKLRDHEVVIVPPGDYHALPWGLLPSLAAQPFSVVPSAALWLARADRRTHSGDVVLVGGPRLDEVTTELARLQQVYPGAIRFTPGRANVERVLGALDGSGLAHVASHGTFRADNPLFSALELTDGPLTVYDIERLDRLPQTMVLSACDAGLPAERPGNEIMGLVAALLAAGTRTVVASTGLVPDTSGTAHLMTSFHRHLAGGSRPARALVAARASLDPLSPEGLAAASFVCFGRS